LGCDSICVKDMAGLLPPSVAYEIVRGLKARVKIPVTVHTHDTAGFAVAAYYAAIEAGVDSVDTAISPFANGTGQPDTWRMLQALPGHPRRPSYDSTRLRRLRHVLEGVYSELAAYTSPKNEVVDNDALTYQVPGGMLSNFRNQLKEQRMADRFAEVMQEMPYVRQCLGWIPLVTPTSQIVGVQAMLNVKFGRWKNFSPEAMKVALGYYGRTPGPIDPEVMALAEKLSGKPRFTGRPADMLEPRMPKLRAELAEKGLPTDDEHCVIYAMFPTEVIKLYQPPAPAVAAKPGSEVKAPGAAQPVIPGTNVKISRLALTIEGRRHEVSVEELA
jgi:oxaloacetate decarboxylase alpha subunit/pyruvate carboxylase subunit B